MVRVEDQKVDILCVGHIIPRKRVEVVLRALAEPVCSERVVHIVGEGISGSDERVKRLARKLGVDERVVWRGKLGRDEVLAAMRSAAVLAHPSGREGASGVVGEAAEVGLPIVCFEGTGAASVMSAGGSPGMAVKSGRDAVRDFANALKEASGLPRGVAGAWTERRLEDLIDDIWVRASRGS
ncbi:glycosyltransferase [Nocardioides sp. Soil777]|uniref:glycosyltransferase n=1 Tax=Nocardioides sp. Soil777 TaxID=1736409 RepID=UPI0039E1512D